MIESSTNDDVTSKESDNNVRLVSLKSENNLKSTVKVLLIDEVIQFFL